MATVETVMEICQRKRGESKGQSVQFTSSQTGVPGEEPEEGGPLVGLYPIPFPPVTGSLFPGVTKALRGKAGATEAPTKVAFMKLLRNEQVSPGQADRAPTMGQRGKLRRGKC